MRTSTIQLGDMLFGRTRSRILNTLYAKPDTTFFVRQLARLLSGSAGTIQRELTTLVAAELVLRTEHENQVLYRANRNHPLFTDLASLLSKTTGAFYVLGEALALFAEQIEFAFVYGSFARAEEKAESDIDLLLVGEVALEELLEVLSPLEHHLKRSINPTIYAQKELRAKIRSGNHFLKAIQDAPLVALVGKEDEFREIR